ncbi:MAG: hypothetical protein HXS40_09815 [Theionarchaea archaeon]|nr:hypothetical protein [Theionarchaea archaeon]
MKTKKIVLEEDETKEVTFDLQERNSWLLGLGAGCCAIILLYVIYRGYRK